MLLAVSHSDSPNAAAQVNSDSIKSAEFTENNSESQNGEIIWGGSMTTLFLFIVFTSLLIINKTYKKKSLNKIKRVLDNDHD